MKKLIHNILNPTNISGCKLWWEGDFTPEQGNLIETSGNDYVYTTIPNRGSLGGDFECPDPAYRPLTTYLESSGYPRRVPRFLDGYQISSLAASNWAFLHQEMTLVFVTFCADTGTLFSTFDDDPNNIGINISVEKESDADILVTVGNGSGSLAVNDGASITEFTDNILHVSSIRLAQTGYDIRIDQITVLEDVPVDTLSGAAPDDTLNIAQRSGNTQPFTGNLIAAAAYDGYLELTELEQIENHFISKYKQQSVHVAQKPTFYFNFNLTPYGYHVDVDNPEEGLRVDRIADFSGNGHDGVQNTDSKQGKF